MTHAKTLLVVGAGAVGGYFGARLAQAGRDVTFLVRARREAQLKTDGLQIVSPHGDITIEPKLVTAETMTHSYDVILLSVKAFALDGAMGDLSRAVGPGSVIIPVLNGMSHMDRLQDNFGAEPLLGGVCIVATELDGEGRIRQLSDIQQLAYGEFDGAVSKRIAEVDRLFQGGGFEARASGTIVRDMWEKWISLASVGAVTCLMRGAIGDVVAQPQGKLWILSLFQECLDIASACGHPPTQDFVIRTTEMLTKAASPMTSSMYRDLATLAPVEADEIIGDLVTRASQAGVGTPLLTTALINLQVYQTSREARAGV